MTGAEFESPLVLTDPRACALLPQHLREFCKLREHLVYIISSVRIVVYRNVGEILSKNPLHFSI